MPFREYRREPTRLQRQLLSGMGYTDRLFLGNRSRLIFYLRIYEYGDKVKLVSVIYAVIRLKKCRVIGMIRWKKCD